MRYANSTRWNDDDDENGEEVVDENDDDDDENDDERDDVVDVRDPVFTTRRQKNTDNDDTHGCSSYDGGKLVVVPADAASMTPMGRGAGGNASDHSPRSTGKMDDIIVDVVDVDAGGIR